MLEFSKKSAIGLDLGDMSFKMAQFEKKRGKFFVSSFVSKDVPGEIVKNGEIKQERELSNLIRSAFDNPIGEPFYGNDVVCNLPEEKVFIRIIHLPYMRKSEIEKAIRWEAEAHIPFNIDKVYLDWRVIETSKNSYVDVLVAATPKDLVDSYVSLLKGSGLYPVALEPESVAVIRSLLDQNDNSKLSIMVDIGATGTNFVIFSDSAIRFSSHISAVSDNSFISALVKEFDIDRKRAEQLKNQVGLDASVRADGFGISSEKVREKLEPIAKELAVQIKEYILFYRNNPIYVKEGGKKDIKVVLCGGGGLLSKLPEFLGKELNLPVSLGSFAEDIKFSGKFRKKFKIRDRTKLLICSVAFGLALRNFI